MLLGVWRLSVGPPRLEHMFDDAVVAAGEAGAPSRGLDASAARGPGEPVGGLDVPAVRAWIAGLGALDGTGLGDGERIELIGVLEDLANATRACQAVLTAQFDRSQRAEQARAGVAPAQRGRGVAAQVALARRESPHRGQQHLGLARVLTQEMPHTLAAFRAGRVGEWRTMVMARETACLALADRRSVDAELAGDPEAFAALGDRQVVVACQRLAARLDPASVVARRRRAESERRVSLRPAPETMAQLSALLPVAQGVAVFAALTRSADTARAGGDARSRGQVMADTLVERVTGQSSAPAVPVRVNLVLTDPTLLGSGSGSGSSNRQRRQRRRQRRRRRGRAAGGSRAHAAARARAARPGPGAREPRG